MGTAGASTCVVPILVSNSFPEWGLGHFPYLVSRSGMFNREDLNEGFYKGLRDIADKVSKADRRKYTLYLFGVATMPEYGSDKKTVRKIKKEIKEAFVSIGIVNCVDLTLQNSKGTLIIIVDGGQKTIRYRYLNSTTESIDVRLYNGHKKLNSNL